MKKKNLWCPPILSFPLGPKTFRGRLWREKVGNLCACVGERREKVDNTAATDEGGKKFRKVMGEGEGCWLFVGSEEEKRKKGVEK